MWFVEFYAEFVDVCLSTQPIWAEYSNKFTTKNLRFAEVNLDRNKELAEKFEIDMSTMSNQLPTLILFEDGEEVMRFPPKDIQKSKWAKKVTYDKNILQ